MNIFHCPQYPCLPPLGSRLSPIIEVDEPPYCIGSVEANNSSQDAQGVRTAVKNTTSTRVSHQENDVVESSSGRRLRAAEVLKQKYVNSDIQDLPRRERGPVRHDRGCRSRPYRLFAPWLQNIPSKFGKILRRHSVTLGLDSYFPFDEELNSSYRCQKFNPTLYDIEYETYDPDDYDQELLALVDKTDDCFKADRYKYDPNVTDYDDRKVNTQEDFVDCLDEFTVRRFKDYESNRESKDAFIRGFLEGIRSAEKAGSDLCSKAIDTLDSHTPLPDPLLSENSFHEMIENNQDVTHRSLSDWEDARLFAMSGKAFEKYTCEEMKNSISDLRRPNVNNSEPFLRSSSAPRPSPSDKIMESHRSKSEEKVFAKSQGKVHSGSSRTSVALCKTDIHFAMEDDDIFDKYDGGNISCPQTKVDRHGIRPCRLKMQDKNPQENWASSKYRSGSEEFVTLDTPEEGMQKIRVKFKHESKTLDKSAAEIDEGTLQPTDCYLENLTFKLQERESGQASKEGNSSFEVQDNQRSEVSKERNSSPNLQEKQRTGLIKETKSSIRNALSPVDQFDAWTTQIKHFTAHDDIHLSSSETLHPVDSVENLKSCDIQTPAGMDEEKWRSARNSVHNKRIHWNETLRLNEKYFETKAFKARRGNCRGNSMISEIQSKQNLVKLRLTKSSCESTSNRNVPVSRCQSLQNRKKFLSEINITKSLDLSEKLTKQLKTLRNLIKPQAIVNYPLTYSKSTISSKARDRKPIQRQYSNRLPCLAESNQGKQLNEICIPLPQIFDRRVCTTEKCALGTDCKNTHFTADHLPPISGTSILNFQMEANPKLQDVNEQLINDYQPALRETGVSDEGTTPDQDTILPAGLFVLNDSLPQNSMLCSVCGGFKVDTSSEIPDKKRSIVKSSPNTQKVHHSVAEVRQAERTPRNPRDKYEPEVDQMTTKKKTKKTKIGEANEDKTKKVNIVFQDNDIKLTCEVTVTKQDSKEASRNEGKDARLIKEIPMPPHRENLGCQVKKKRRIYRKRNEKSKQGGDTGDVTNLNKTEGMTNEVTFPSAYLEYCKRKEKLRASKQNVLHEDSVNLVSDTQAAELNGKVTLPKRYWLPVIPSKRSFDKIKLINCYENRLFSKSKSSFTKTMRTKEYRGIDTNNCLSVTPCMLPNLTKTEKLNNRTFKNVIKS